MMISHEPLMTFQQQIKRLVPVKSALLFWLEIIQKQVIPQVAP